MTKRHDGYIHDEEDMLPRNHPLANEVINCKCGQMLHASNNEFMTVWIELEDRNLCADCWYKEINK